MAAIFFGFMYCNKPTQAELESRRAAAEAAATTSTAAPEAVATPDSLDTVQAEAFANAVKTLGTAAGDGSYTLSDGTFDLRLDSTMLSGAVKAGGGSVTVRQLRAGSDASVPATQRAEAMKAVSELVAKVQKYRDFARHLGGENTTTVLENDVLRLEIASRGGMVSGATLKNYTTEVGENPGEIELFQGGDDGYGFTFNTSDQRLDTREFNFTPVVESDTSVLMTLRLADEVEWGIRYKLRPGSYVVGMEVVQRGLGKVLPASTSSVDFNWHQTMARNEKGRTFEERNSGIFYKYVGEGPDDLNSTNDDSEQLNGRVMWVAFTNQYFSSVIIPRASFARAVVR